MHLVLDKEVYQRHNSCKEGTGKVLSVLYSGRVPRTQGQNTGGPRNGSHKIRDHENVMPVVVIRRCDICPSSASQGAEDADTCNKLR
jgi:hypothetical protein